MVGFACVRVGILAWGVFGVVLVYLGTLVLDLLHERRLRRAKAVERYCEDCKWFRASNEDHAYDSCLRYECQGNVGLVSREHYKVVPALCRRVAGPCGPKGKYFEAK